MYAGPHLHTRCACLSAVAPLPLPCCPLTPPPSLAPRTPPHTQMHVLMFALWSEHAAGRNGGLTLRRWRLPQRHQLPAPPLPASSPAAAAGVGHGHESVQQQAGYQLHTSPAAAAGHGQQQQSGNRELLCDEEQLLLLGDASLANSSSECHSHALTNKAQHTVANHHGLYSVPVSSKAQQGVFVFAFDLLDCVGNSLCSTTGLHSKALLLEGSRTWGCLSQLLYCLSSVPLFLLLLPLLLLVLFLLLFLLPPLLFLRPLCLSLFLLLLLLLLLFPLLLVLAGLVQEVWVARGKGSTCPLSTGIIYFGCQQQQQQQQTPSLAASAGGGNGSIDSSSGGVPTAAGPAARGAGAAGAAAPTAAAGQAARDPGAALSQQLGHTLQQPWVTVTDGLNSAAAVFAAAEAGQLPAVLDYAAGSSAEWIEFEKPTQSELQQQQQHRLAAAGSSIGSSQLSGVVFFPVLWFR